jgi:hypothetical protein
MTEKDVASTRPGENHEHTKFVHPVFWLRFGFGISAWRNRKALI